MYNCPGASGQEPPAASVVAFGDGPGGELGVEECRAGGQKRQDEERLVSAGGSTFVGAFADRGLFDEAFFVLALLAAGAALLYAQLPSRAVAKRDH